VVLGEIILVVDAMLLGAVDVGLKVDNFIVENLSSKFIDDDEDADDEEDTADFDTVMALAGSSADFFVLVTVSARISTLFWRLLLATSQFVTRMVPKSHEMSF
jgi:hypothetical protein